MVVVFQSQRVHTGVYSQRLAYSNTACTLSDIFMRVEVVVWIEQVIVLRQLLVDLLLEVVAVRLDNIVLLLRVVPWELAWFIVVTVWAKLIARPLFTFLFLQHLGGFFYMLLSGWLLLHLLLGFWCWLVLRFQWWLGDICLGLGVGFLLLLVGLLVAVVLLFDLRLREERWMLLLWLLFLTDARGRSVVA